MRFMNYLIAFLFLCSLVLFAIANFAMAQGGGQPPADGGAFMNAMSVEEEAESLAAQLGLSMDQKGKILDVLKVREEGKLYVQENFPVAQPGSPPSAEGIAAMDKVMATARAGILDVLDDGQKVKYEAANPVSSGGPPEAGR